MKTILLSVLLMGTIIANSQTEQTMPMLNNFWMSDTCDIRCFFAEAYDKTKMNRFNAYKYNFISCFRFNIDTSGNVINVAGNIVTPAFLFSYIDSILRLSNGKWIPSMVGGKKVVSKPLLLPVVYLYEPNLGVETKSKLPGFDYFMFQYSITQMNVFDSEPKYSAKPEYRKNTGNGFIKPWLSNDKPLDCYFLKPICITPNLII